MSQIELMLVPLLGGEPEGEALNKFLRGHRVIKIDRQIVTDPFPAWAFCIEYLEGDKKMRSRVDYREVLSPEHFAIFSRLRDIRKRLAEVDGVPVYTVFSNEQLACIAREGIGDLKGLRGLDGVGEAKVEKYGEAILKGMGAEK